MQQETQAETNLPDFDKELALQWLARLEGNKIEQTKGFLIQPNGSMCCLGVLCDTAKLEITAQKDAFVNPTTKQRVQGMPTEDVLNRVGLTLYIPKTFDDKSHSHLINAKQFAQMNDYGDSFPRIARALRKVYEARNLL